MAGLGYQLVAQPILTWATGILGAAIGAALPVAPVLDGSTLATLLTGILGLGTMRTIERTNGVPGAMPGGGAK